MSRSKRVARWVFGPAVALALGVGAMDAMAAPSARGADARVCDPQVCNRICQAIGTIGGTCINGGCSCYISTP